MGPPDRHTDRGSPKSQPLAQPCLRLPACSGTLRRPLLARVSVLGKVGRPATHGQTPVTGACWAAFGSVVLSRLRRAASRKAWPAPWQAVAFVWPIPSPARISSLLMGLGREHNVYYVEPAHLSRSPSRNKRCYVLCHKWAPCPRCFCLFSLSL